ncbi:MAG TPA: ABC transporter permease [Polyangiaceae bacterium]|nr:ABC transporter permease [Polyangiaceae bacterium]
MRPASGVGLEMGADVLAAPAAKTRPRRRGLFTLRGELSARAYGSIAVAVFAALFVGWCTLSYGNLVSPLFLPTPSRVLDAGVELAKSGELLRDLWASNLRIVSGFLLATAVSLPLGLLMGNIRFFAALIEPLLGFVRYLPVPAFIPLLILYTGIGETPKLLVIFIGAVVQMVLMIADATKQTSSELLRAALTLGASRRELFSRVIWPSSMPQIVDVLRLNLGWSWTYLVVAEMVAAGEGLGYRILKAQRFLRVDVIFFYLLVIGVLGVSSDLLFRVVQKRRFPWAEEKLES